VQELTEWLRNWVAITTRNLAGVGKYRNDPMLHSRSWASSPDTEKSETGSGKDKARGQEVSGETHREVLAENERHVRWVIATVPLSYLLQND